MLNNTLGALGERFILIKMHHKINQNASLLCVPGTLDGVSWGLNLYPSSILLLFFFLWLFVPNCQRCNVQSAFCLLQFVYFTFAHVKLKIVPLALLNVIRSNILYMITWLKFDFPYWIVEAVSDDSWSCIFALESRFSARD